MKKEYKERRAAKHAAQKAAKTNKKASDSMTPNDVMKFFRQFRGAKDEHGMELKSQASELLHGGWDGIGYTMVATSPDLATTGIARKRCVFASHGDQAVLEFQGWYRGCVEQGYVAGWRYYLSSKRNVMEDDEFKGQLVYRKIEDTGSVLVEFAPLIIVPLSGAISQEDYKRAVREVSTGMRVDKVADMFLFMLRLGAKIGWFHSRSLNA